MKNQLLKYSVAVLTGLCGISQGAELSEGSGLSPESAVEVLSAETMDDLERSITTWVKQRYPEDTITVRRYQYLADDRAQLVIKTLTIEGMHRSIFFETPGLPSQFLREKPSVREK